MKCPVCGAENQESAAFCNLCLHEFDQDQAPEAMDAPAPATPPAAGVTYHQPGAPPSDVYAQQPYRPPGPPMTPRADGVRRIPQWVQTLVGILVTAVFFVVGWYLAGLLFNRDKTYSSSTSNITLKYPGKWKQVEMSSFEGFTTLGVEGKEVYKEIMLADTPGDDTKYFVFVGRLPAVPPEAWAEVKSTFETSIQSPGTANAAPGVTVSAPTFEDETVAGCLAFSTKFTVSGMGMAYECDAMLIQNSVNTYLIVFMNEQKESPEPLNKIKDSIKFKS